MYENEVDWMREWILKKWQLKIQIEGPSVFPKNKLLNCED